MTTTDWNAINCPNFQGDIGKKARMAILRRGIAKTPFKLSELTQDAGGASDRTMRTQARRLVDEKALVMLAPGTYIAASAYRPELHGKKSEEQSRKPFLCSEEEMLSFLQKPRTMVEIGRKLGREAKASRLWIKPLIEAGRVHRVQLGNARIYCCSLDTLNELVRTREEARKPVKTVRSAPVRSIKRVRTHRHGTRFGHVSRLAAEILRHRPEAPSFPCSTRKDIA